MTQNTYRLKYPRKSLSRKSFAFCGRFLMATLAKVEITGRDLLPRKGPIILAGNHVAALEAVMMAAYTPGIVEFIGNGDIPFDPNYAFLVNGYGLIPINRGNLDRSGLLTAVDVLAQDGILGIFPEGGTWDPAHMQAQSGVAWLSYKAQAPVLPIGFGGLKKNALHDFLHFKRPPLSMHVGNLIPPVTITDAALSLKENLEAAAKMVLSEIQKLIPTGDLLQLNRRENEKHHLEVEVISAGKKIDLPDEYHVHHGEAYARFLYNPTLLDVLVRNLHLPLKPLKRINVQAALAPILKAWQSILDYLETNPGFFTYRFGVQQGLDVKQALTELLNLGEWALQSGYSLKIEPIRTYQNTTTGDQVVERGGCFPKSM